ncbi:hypothetical protein [Clostridium sp. CCUG 7971]|uniref:hypothetical protein n=1 Tax=Clostridium sp. CCUG 7971 TaxID=2811414 RepID=UPI001ABB3D61|nr:hypothetical protein [Clostridium sp. CCUG 7971]MBO3444111.1 hypothetical protein [Clostridium sp. CCUG 7971]
MKEYLLESDIEKLKYDFELKKEQCFCGEGYIYKVERCGFTKKGNRYGVDEFEEIKEITCDFCRNNYYELETIKSTIRDIHHLEDMLYNYYYDQKCKNHNMELIEEKNTLLEKYHLVKAKLDKLNITDLPSSLFTKRQWARYFVENNLTELNEKECFKQVFYGANKFGLDIFLNTVGITIEDYIAFSRAKLLSLEGDRIQRLKNEILDKKNYLLQHEAFVQVILDNKDEIKDFNYIKILEKLAEESEAIREHRNKQVEEFLDDSLDYHEDDIYLKSDIAFYVEDALDYVLNKFEDSNNSILRNQENKRTFIKEYICEVLGEEYTQEDYEYDFDDVFEDEKDYDE